MARRRELGIDGAHRVLRTSLRVTGAVALAVALASWVLAALGLWAAFLGVPGSWNVEVAVAVALTLFAAGLPLELSSRLLLGAERNDVALAFGASASVLTLLIVIVAAAAHAPLWAYVAAPSTGQAIAASAAWPAALSASGLSWSEAVASAAVLSRPGAHIAHLAGPMLVITVAVPIAFQSDRLLLSHLSTLEQVAIYGVAAQLYGTLIGVVWASGMSLWPIFARRRAFQPVSRRELIEVSSVFFSVAPSSQPAFA